MTYAVPSDVANELGRPVNSLTEPERIQFEGWLRRVEAILRHRIPDLDDLVTAGSIAEATVVSVEAAAVARKAVNPDGLRSITRAIDDGSVTRVRDNTLSDGQLRITDDEWALLLPRRARGAFTIRPAYGA